MLNPEKIWHQQLVHLPTSSVPLHLEKFQKNSHFQQYYSCIGLLQIIYVISGVNKLLSPYPPHLKNVTALPCKMKNFFIWLKLMLRSTTLRWNSAHVATKLFRNASVSRIGIRYTRCCSIQTGLYQPHLRWPWSKTQRAVLPRRVADAEAVTGNPQNCWRRVCLPARQCASTSCSWHSRASEL